MGLFQFLKPAHEGVVGGVADLGPVENVVKMLVAPEFGSQLFQFFLCRHFYNRNYVSDPSAAVLIYNPVAGKIFSRPQMIPMAAEAMRSRLGGIRLLPTTGPRTAGAIARAAVEAGASMICVAGGDGTINEVAAGMAGSKTPLAVLPAGTANVFAMEAGIGGNMRRALERFDDLEARDVHLGRIKAHGQEERLFLLMAGAGLDARIVRLVSPEFKRRWGKLSYWEAGFAQLGKRLPEFDLTIDGKQVRSSFALISRVRNYGGDLEIARHANLLSDDFAVVTFEGPSSGRYLKYFSGVLLNALDGMSGVMVTRARRLEIQPDPGVDIDLQVDGEHAGFAPARIDIAPQTLRLMLPKRFVERMSSCLPQQEHVG